MATSGSGDGAPLTEATLKEVVAALGEIVERVAQATGVDGGAAAGFRGDNRPRRPGEREPSVDQIRTALDYRVVGAMVGRTVSADLTVAAERLSASGRDQVKIHGIPHTAVWVSVQAVGDPTPEVLPLGGGPGHGSGQGSGQDRTRTVTLDKTAGKDIARIELLNGAYEPVRLGPRLARLPGGLLVE